MYLELYEYDVKKVKYFVDKGVSAGSMRRAQLQKMIEEIQAGELDEVVIYKLDRLTRSVLDIYGMLQIFLGNDVNLVAVMDNLDIKTANGRMLMGVLAILAQWEREIIIERTNDGLLQKAAEGKYPLPLSPLGYKKDDDGYLTIDPYESKIVKEIFTLAIGGMPYAGISEYVQGKYNLYLSTKRVKKILFEQGYYGEFSYKGYVFNDVMPAIIKKEIVKEAQEITGKKHCDYGGEQAKYWFRHKIRCADCGNITFGVPTHKKDKKYFYYYCKKCKKRINQDMVVDMTLLDMIKVLRSLELKSDIEEIEKNINSLKIKIKKLTKRYTQEKMTVDAYTIAVNEIEKQIAKYKAMAGSVKIVNERNWGSLNDNEKHALVERAILTMTIDLDKKTIIKIEYIYK